MCGIFFYKSSVELPKNKINWILENLKKRGPDFQNFIQYKLDEKFIYLFHGRLTIIDQNNSANQPLITNQNNSIVFNGEIYNFKLLKIDLQNKYKTLFHTNSDTEVIIKGYEEEGIKFFDKLRGMYAFIIFDNNQKKLILATDNQSIKFLFNYEDGQDLIISSELSIMKNFLNKKLSINTKSIEQIISFGSVQENMSIYNNINKFVPGHIYELKIFENNSFKPIDRIFHEYDDSDINYLLRESFYSEAKSALLFSGGSDSSLLLNEIKKLNLDNLFVSKLLLIEGDSNQFNIFHNYHEYNLNIDYEEFQNDFLNYSQIIDYPSDDGLNVYIITKKLKQFGIKVVFSGAGGDEIFGGYQSKRFFNLIKYYYNLPLRRSLDFIFSRSLKSGNIRNKVLSLKYLNEYSPDILFLLRSIFTPVEKKLYFNFFTNFKDLSSNLYRDLSNFNNFNSNYEMISFFESELYLSNQLLHIGDISSMANSIEMRFPILNLKYYKYLQQNLVNNKNKLKKYREINNLNLKRNIKFKKKGFTLPIYRVLRDNKKIISEVILDSNFKRDYCKSFFETYIKNLFNNLTNKSNQHKINLLYNISSWIG